MVKREECDSLCELCEKCDCETEGEPGSQCDRLCAVDFVRALVRAEAARPVAGGKDQEWSGGKKSGF